MQQGYVVKEQDRLRLVDPRALLNAWSTVYQPPYQRTAFYIMREAADIESTVARWCKRKHISYGLGEFAGAWRLAPMVRHKQATVVVRHDQAMDVVRELQKELDAKTVESGSNLMLLDTTDEAVFFDARTVEDLQVLAPLQLYLDLKCQHGRGQEAADEILRRLLLPNWQPLSAGKGI
jgi:hypothetical protein